MSRAVFTSFFPHSLLLLYQSWLTMSSFFCAYLQLFCCHYHHDIKCQDKNAESIILCLKYYFRLRGPLSDYMGYIMTIFLTWMVGRDGVEPSQSQTADLQSGPLLVTVYLPICGGADKNRTCYPLRAREMLYQMSYSPKNRKAY